MTEYQTRTNQGGSVAPFMIGAIVLVALAVGGLTFLHKRTDTSPANSPVAIKSPSVAPSQSSIPPSSNPSSAPTKTPPATVSPSVTPGPSTPLPKTGPTDLMPAGFVLAIIVGLSTSYIRSRISSSTNSLQ